MSWRIAFLTAWFNIVETSLAVVSLCAFLYGMTIVLDPPNPDYFYAIKLGRPPGLLGLVLSFAVSIGPMAIFETVTTSVVPLPYRWLGMRLLPSSQVVFPWQR